LALKEKRWYKRGHCANVYATRTTEGFSTEDVRHFTGSPARAGPAYRTVELMVAILARPDKRSGKTELLYYSDWNQELQMPVDLNQLRTTALSMASKTV